MHTPPAAREDLLDLGAASGPLRLVSSLRYRDWRYLWSGLMAAQTGEWMDNIGINWLVLVQTNSPLALGLVNLSRGLPQLFLALPSGVIADRVDRRTLMIWSQAGNVLCTVLLAALASTGTLEVGLIYVVLVARGTVSSFFQPARGSIIGDLVPPSDYSNAVVLHSAVFNATRMVGPAIAGVLIGAMGSGIGGSAFVIWLNVAAQSISVGTLLAMRPPPRVAPRPGVSAWSTFTDGLRYIWREPAVLVLMILSIVPFLLGQPYSSMLPVFARDVLDIGPRGLGLLTASAATGSLVGAFLVAGLGNFQRKGLAMMLGLMLYGGLLLAFAQTPWPLVAAMLLVLVGASFQLYATTNSTLVLLIVPSEYRGRVMGVHQMDRGFIPLGSFIAGSLAEHNGAPFATTLMGGCLTLVAATILVLAPRVRRL